MKRVNAACICQTLHFFPKEGDPAEMPGIPCYDRPIIERIAEESGYSRSYVKTEGNAQK